jgi:hypothetical protein
MTGLYCRAVFLRSRSAVVVPYSDGLGGGDDNMSNRSSITSQHPTISSDDDVVVVVAALVLAVVDVDEEATATYMHLLNSFVDESDISSNWAFCIAFRLTSFHFLFSHE